MYKEVPFHFGNHLDPDLHSYCYSCCYLLFSGDSRARQLRTNCIGGHARCATLQVAIFTIMRLFVWLGATVTVVGQSAMDSLEPPILLLLLLLLLEVAVQPLSLTTHC